MSFEADVDFSAEEPRNEDLDMEFPVEVGEGMSVTDLMVITFGAPWLFLPKRR